MMSLKYFVCALILYFADGFPLDEYYVNGDVGSSLTNLQPYVYSYQPEVVYQQYQNDINKPIYEPELGMNPQYHNLVFNYVKNYGGTDPPLYVNVLDPNSFNSQNQVPVQGNVPVSSENYPTNVVNKDTTNDQMASATDKPGLNERFLPSDLTSLPNQSKSQFLENFNALKMKKVKPNARPTNLPPIAGVVSNYVLLRSQPNYQNLLQYPISTKEKDSALQHIKRETPDEDDSVVIYAEPLQNIKNREDAAEHKEDMNDDDQNEGESGLPQPSIAQSKPSAIALAGLGGVAQASPVATAVVGKGGLAVSAPSGTAVAGPTGKGSLPLLIGNEKKKTDKDDD